MIYQFLRRYCGMIGSLYLAGCTFNIDVPSQRTSLENQVIGSYQELDDDLILVSSVRGTKTSSKAAMSPSKAGALEARQNQDFNRDDVDELKDKQILGEGNDGNLSLVPTGKAAAKTDAKDVALARSLLVEENQNRATIWQRIIASNANLQSKDLPEVRKTYAKLQRAGTAPGQWYEDEEGHWLRKEGTDSAK